MYKEISMVAIPVDKWCCGNCKLNKDCKRGEQSIACHLIHKNYQDNGRKGLWAGLGIAQLRNFLHARMPGIL